MRFSVVLSLEPDVRMPSDSIVQKPLVANNSADSAPRIARVVLTQLFGPPSARTFAVRLWDGSTEHPERPARFTLILRRPGALRRMLLPPTERRLGAAYVRGDIDIEGDLAAAAALTGTIAQHVRRPNTAFGLLMRLLRLRDDSAEWDTTSARRPHWNVGARHSRRRDAAAIRHHYDVGNDFYRLWLDRRMVYSCAYFPNGDEDLDSAQEAKLDLICRKLRLRPGERLLDVGCGWGALVMHAAERYGVDATGITLSREQATLARERVAQAGLSDRCRIELVDYRDLPTTPFDKIASVGMVEHVGRAMLPTYFHHVFRLLAPGGLFLNHGIVTLEPTRSVLPGWLAQRVHRCRSFIDAYVFPDGELVTPPEVLGPATTAGFELRDVESLREHYARTLRHWVRRLEARHEEAVALVGEPTYRVWRAYMAGCAHAFASGGIGIIQTLLGKRDGNGVVHVPRTRADLYAPHPAATDPEAA